MHPVAEEVDEASDEAKPGYSIRVASRLTGVSSDTLRMWERRYGFPKPARNGSQVRVYSDADIERLILVSRALKTGFRAGEVIHRSIEELRDALANSAKVERAEETQQSPTIIGLLEYLRDDDAAGLRNALRQAVATLGTRQFLLNVAGPLVQMVGDYWAIGRLQVRHEHLLTATLSTQLRLLLSAYETDTRPPTIVLAALSQEQHGLGLEMAALFLALEGATPRLIGVDTPRDQIVEAAVALRADVVGLSVSQSANPTTTAEHVRWMLSRLPANIEIWLGGRASPLLGLSQERLYQTVTWEDTLIELNRVRKRVA